MRRAPCLWCGRSRDEVRLLTLTGPGGTGKTRLGAQAAGLVSEAYPDGVYWVPLAPLLDPELVLPSAAQALGARDGLAEHVGGRRMLILFDNFEQVVEAAGGLAELLSACPNLDLLVTSREPLHLTAEYEYAVPTFAHEDGVRFFFARARAVQPAFEANGVVASICRRLDYLPLALELAAARVKALTAEQILARLEQRLPLLTGGARDLPARQQTLRATIEWSHELLSKEEQRLFRDLSVRRRLHPRSCRGDRQRRSGHAPIAPGQEPAPPHRRSLLDARDDPRVRGRATRRDRKCCSPSPQTRRLVSHARRDAEQ